MVAEPASKLFRGQTLSSGVQQDKIVGSINLREQALALQGYDMAWGFTLLGLDFT